MTVNGSLFAGRPLIIRRAWPRNWGSRPSFLEVDKPNSDMDAESDVDGGPSDEATRLRLSAIEYNRNVSLGHERFVYILAGHALAAMEHMQNPGDGISLSRPGDDLFIARRAHNLSAFLAFTYPREVRAESQSEEFEPPSREAVAAEAERRARYEAQGRSAYLETEEEEAMIYEVPDDITDGPISGYNSDV